MKCKSAFLILISGILFPVFSQAVLDGIAAIVNDEVILQSEVIQGAYQMAMQMGIDLNKNPRELDKLRKIALENLVNTQVLLIQAEKDTVEANEKQIESTLEQQMQFLTQQLGGQEKVEEYFGLPMSKIRRTYRTQIEKNLRVSAVRDQKLAGLKMTRREVMQFFNTMRDSIGSIKETVDLSHILIQTKPGEEARKEAFEKIKNIRERSVDGEDFAKLAEKYSDDPGSATRGGNLGFMSRGDFVREFEEAAFNLQPGEISEIIETEFGYHIIRLEERRGEKINASHVLISLKPTQDDEVKAAEKIKEIYTELKSGKNFEELVEKYSMDQSTKEDKGHLGRFELDQLRETAKEFVYAINGVEPGEFSEPIKTKYGFHILKLNFRDEPREYTLEKDWDRIEDMALEYKKQTEFQKWLNELKKDIYIEIKGQST